MIYTPLKSRQYNRLIRITSIVVLVAFVSTTLLQDVALAKEAMDFLRASPAVETRTGMMAVEGALPLPEEIGPPNLPIKEVEDVPKIHTSPVKDNKPEENATPESPEIKVRFLPTKDAIRKTLKDVKKFLIYLAITTPILLGINYLIVCHIISSADEIWVVADSGDLLSQAKQYYAEKFDSKDILYFLKGDPRPDYPPLASIHFTTIPKIGLADTKLLLPMVICFYFSLIADMNDLKGKNIIRPLTVVGFSFFFCGVILNFIDMVLWHGVWDYLGGVSPGDIILAIGFNAAFFVIVGGYFRIMWRPIKNMPGRREKEKSAGDTPEINPGTPQNSDSAPSPSTKEWQDMALWEKAFNILAILTFRPISSKNLTNMAEGFFVAYSRWELIEESEKENKQEKDRDTRTSPVEEGKRDKLSRRSAQQLEEDRRKLRTLLAKGPIDAKTASEKTGIPVHLVVNDFGRIPEFRDHPNRKAIEVKIRTSEQRKKDRKRLKELLDNEGPHTPKQASEKTGIPHQHVKNDFVKDPELKNHPNRVLSDREERSTGQIIEDRRRLKALLDEGPYGIAELSTKTGIPVETVRNDIRSEELIDHPNLQVRELVKRSPEQLEKDRQRLTELLDKEPLTTRECADKTGIPILIVRNDLIRIAHPNWINVSIAIRTPEELESHRKALKHWLDKGRHTVRQLSEKTGIPINIVTHDIYGTDLRFHPNLDIRETHVRSVDKVREDCLELKTLLDKKPYTPNQLSSLTSIPIMTVYLDLYRGPELKNHPNKIYEKEHRTNEEIESNRKVLKELLNKGPHTTRMLADITGIPRKIVSYDLVKDPELRGHPNWIILERKERSPDQIVEDRRRLKELLDEAPHTIRELSKKTGIPIQTVSNDIRSAELRGHPNIRIHRRNQGIYTRSVVECYTGQDFSATMPSDNAEFFELLEKTLTKDELEFIRLDLETEDMSDEELAEALKLYAAELVQRRLEIWDKVAASIRKDKPAKDSAIEAYLALRNSPEHKNADLLSRIILANTTFSKYHSGNKVKTADLLRFHLQTSLQENPLLDKFRNRTEKLIARYEKDKPLTPEEFDEILESPELGISGMGTFIVGIILGIAFRVRKLNPEDFLKSDEIIFSNNADELCWRDLYRASRVGGYIDNVSLLDTLLNNTALQARIIKSGKPLEFGPGYIYCSVEDLRETLRTGKIKAGTSFTRKPNDCANLDFRKGCENPAIIAIRTETFNRLQKEGKASIKIWEISWGVTQEIEVPLNLNDGAEIWVSEDTYEDLEKDSLLEDRIKKIPGLRHRSLDGQKAFSESGGRIVDYMDSRGLVTNTPFLRIASHANQDREHKKAKAGLSEAVNEEDGPVEPQEKVQLPTKPNITDLQNVYPIAIRTSPVENNMSQPSEAEDVTSKRNVPSKKLLGLWAAALIVGMLGYPPDFMQPYAPYIKYSVLTAVAITTITYVATRIWRVVREQEASDRISMPKAISTGAPDENVRTSPITVSNIKKHLRRLAGFLGGEEGGRIEEIIEYHEGASREIIHSHGKELRDAENGIYIYFQTLPKHALRTIRDLRKHGYLKPGTKFVDLGSADGFMVHLVNTMTKGVETTGIEKDFRLMQEAQRVSKYLNRLKKHKWKRTAVDKKRVRWIQGDFLEQDLSEFDILYIYPPMHVPEGQKAGPIKRNGLRGVGNLVSSINYREIINKMKPGAILIINNNQGFDEIGRLRNVEFIPEIRGWKKLTKPASASPPKAAFLKNRSTRTRTSPTEIERLTEQLRQAETTREMIEAIDGLGNIIAIGSDTQGILDNRIIALNTSQDGVVDLFNTAFCHKKIAALAHYGNALNIPDPIEDISLPSLVKSVERKGVILSPNTDNGELYVLNAGAVEINGITYLFPRVHIKNNNEGGSVNAYSIIGIVGLGRDGSVIKPLRKFIDPQENLYNADGTMSFESKVREYGAEDTRITRIGDYIYASFTLAPMPERKILPDGTEEEEREWWKRWRTHTVTARFKIEDVENGVFRGEYLPDASLFEDWSAADPGSGIVKEIRGIDPDIIRSKNGFPTGLYRDDQYLALARPSYICPTDNDYSIGRVFWAGARSLEGPYRVIKEAWRVRDGRDTQGLVFDSLHVGTVAPPVESPIGYISLYHGVSKTIDGTVYRLGIMILDSEDPTKILYRSWLPILIPEKDYELKGGWVNNVVYSCGFIPRLEENKLIIYYGAADKHMAVAELTLRDGWRTLEAHELRAMQDAELTRLKELQVALRTSPTDSSGIVEYGMEVDAIINLFRRQPIGEIWDKIDAMLRPQDYSLQELRDLRKSMEGYFNRQDPVSAKEGSEVVDDKEAFDYFLCEKEYWSFLLRIKDFLMNEDPPDIETMGVFQAMLKGYARALEGIEEKPYLLRKADYIRDIISRKPQNLDIEELEELERFFRGLFDDMHEAIVEIDEKLESLKSFHEKAVQYYANLTGSLTGLAFIFSPDINTDQGILSEEFAEEKIGAIPWDIKDPIERAIELAELIMNEAEEGEPLSDVDKNLHIESLTSMVSEIQDLWGQVRDWPTDEIPPDLKRRIRAENGPLIRAIANLNGLKDALEARTSPTEKDQELEQLERILQEEHLTDPYLLGNIIATLRIKYSEEELRHLRQSIEEYLVGEHPFHTFQTEEASLGYYLKSERSFWRFVLDLKDMLIYESPFDIRAIVALDNYLRNRITALKNKTESQDEPVTYTEEVVSVMEDIMAQELLSTERKEQEEFESLREFFAELFDDLCDAQFRVEETLKKNEPLYSMAERAMVLISNTSEDLRIALEFALGSPMPVEIETAIEDTMELVRVLVNKAESDEDSLMPLDAEARERFLPLLEVGISAVVEICNTISNYPDLTSQERNEMIGDSSHLSKTTALLNDLKDALETRRTSPAADETTEDKPAVSEGREALMTPLMRCLFEQRGWKLDKVPYYEVALLWLTAIALSHFIPGWLSGVITGTIYITLYFNRISQLPINLARRIFHKEAINLPDDGPPAKLFIPVAFINTAAMAISLSFIPVSIIRLIRLISILAFNSTIFCAAKFIPYLYLIVFIGAIHKLLHFKKQDIKISSLQRIRNWVKTLKFQFKLRRIFEITGVTAIIAAGCGYIARGQIPEELITANHWLLSNRYRMAAPVIFTLLLYYALIIKISGIYSKRIHENPHITFIGLASFVSIAFASIAVLWIVANATPELLLMAMWTGIVLNVWMYARRAFLWGYNKFTGQTTQEPETQKTQDPQPPTQDPKAPKTSPAEERHGPLTRRNFLLATLAGTALGTLPNPAFSEERGLHFDVDDKINDYTDGECPEVIKESIREALRTLIRKNEFRRFQIERIDITLTPEHEILVSPIASRDWDRSSPPLKDVLFTKDDLINRKLRNKRIEELEKSILGRSYTPVEKHGFKWIGYLLKVFLFSTVAAIIGLILRDMARAYLKYHRNERERKRVRKDYDYQKRQADRGGRGPRTSPASEPTSPAESRKEEKTERSSTNKGDEEVDWEAHFSGKTNPPDTKFQFTLRSLLLLQAMVILLLFGYSSIFGANSFVQHERDLLYVLSKNLAILIMFGVPILAFGAFKIVSGFLDAFESPKDNPQGLRPEAGPFYLIQMIGASTTLFGWLSFTAFYQAEFRIRRVLIPAMFSLKISLFLFWIASILATWTVYYMVKRVLQERKNKDKEDVPQPKARGVPDASHKVSPDDKGKTSPAESMETVSSPGMDGRITQVILNGQTVTTAEMRKTAAELIEGYFLFNTKVEDGKLLFGWTTNHAERHNSPDLIPRQAIGTFAGFMSEEGNFYLVPDLTNNIVARGEGAIRDYHNRSIVMARVLITHGFPGTLPLKLDAKKSLEEKLLFGKGNLQILQDLADEPFISLTAASVSPEKKKDQAKGLKVDREITIETLAGLHTRPSGIISSLVSRIKDAFGINSTLKNVHTGETLDADLTINLTSLGLEHNSKAVISIKGPYSAEKLNKVLDIFEGILAVRVWPVEALSKEEIQKVIARRHFDTTRRIIQPTPSKTSPPNAISPGKPDTGRRTSPAERQDPSFDTSVVPESLFPIDQITTELNRKHIPVDLKVEVVEMNAKIIALRLFNGKKRMATLVLRISSDELEIESLVPFRLPNADILATKEASYDVIKKSSCWQGPVETRRYHNLVRRGEIVYFELAEGIRREHIGPIWYQKHVEPYLIKCGVSVASIQGTCLTDMSVFSFWRHQGFGRNFCLNHLYHVDVVEQIVLLKALPTTPQTSPASERTPAKSATAHITIEYAKPEDRDKIIEIWQKDFLSEQVSTQAIETYHKTLVSMMKNEWQYPTTIFIAKESGETVGYMLVQQRSVIGNKKAAYIKEIAIRKEDQNRGIGKRLLTYALKWIEDTMEVECVQIMDGTVDKRMNKIAEELGFKYDENALLSLRVQSPSIRVSPDDKAKTSPAETWFSRKDVSRITEVVTGIWQSLKTKRWPRYACLEIEMLHEILSGEHEIDIELDTLRSLLDSSAFNESLKLYNLDCIWVDGNHNELSVFSTKGTDRKLQGLMIEKARREALREAQIRETRKANNSGFISWCGKLHSVHRDRAGQTFTVIPYDGEDKHSGFIAYEKTGSSMKEVASYKAETGERWVKDPAVTHKEKITYTPYVIISALEKAHGHQGGAAEILDISRSTLTRQIKMIRETADKNTRRRLEYADKDVEHIVSVLEKANGYEATAARILKIHPKVMTSKVKTAKRLATEFEDRDMLLRIHMVLGKTVNDEPPDLKTSPAEGRTSPFSVNKAIEKIKMAESYLNEHANSDARGLLMDMAGVRRKIELIQVEAGERAKLIPVILRDLYHLRRTINENTELFGLDDQQRDKVAGRAGYITKAARYIQWSGRVKLLGKIGLRLGIVFGKVSNALGLLKKKHSVYIINNRNDGISIKPLEDMLIEWAENNNAEKMTVEIDKKCLRIKTVIEGHEKFLSLHYEIKDAKLKMGRILTDIYQQSSLSNVLVTYMIQAHGIHIVRYIIPDWKVLPHVRKMKEAGIYSKIWGRDSSDRSCVVAKNWRTKPPKTSPASEPALPEELARIRKFFAGMVDIEIGESSDAQVVMTQKAQMNLAGSRYLLELAEQFGALLILPDGRRLEDITSVAGECQATENGIAVLVKPDPESGHKPMPLEVTRRTSPVEEDEDDGSEIEKAMTLVSQLTLELDRWRVPMQEVGPEHRGPALDRAVHAFKRRVIGAKVCLTRSENRSDALSQLQMAHSTGNEEKRARHLAAAVSKVKRAASIIETAITQYDKAYKAEGTKRGWEGWPVFDAESIKKRFLLPIDSIIKLIGTEEAPLEEQPKPETDKDQHRLVKVTPNADVRAAQEEMIRKQAQAVSDIERDKDKRLIRYTINLDEWDFSKGDHTSPAEMDEDEEWKDAFKWDPEADYVKSRQTRHSFYVDHIANLFDKHIIPGSAVLEGGSGSSWLFTALPDEHKSHLVQLDFDPDAISYARKRNRGKKFIQAYIDKIPVKDKTFDAFVALEFLDVLEETTQRDAFKEINRILRLNGKVILLADHKFSCTFGLYERLNKLANETFSGEEIICANGREVFEWGIDEVTAEMKQTFDQKYEQAEGERKEDLELLGELIRQRGEYYIVPNLAKLHIIRFTQLARHYGFKTVERGTMELPRRYVGDLEYVVFEKISSLTSPATAETIELDPTASLPEQIIWGYILSSAHEGGDFTQYLTEISDIANEPEERAYLKKAIGNRTLFMNIMKYLSSPDFSTRLQSVANGGRNDLAKKTMLDRVEHLLDVAKSTVTLREAMADTVEGTLSLSTSPVAGTPISSGLLKDTERKYNDYEASVAIDSGA